MEEIDFMTELSQFNDSHPGYRHVMYLRDTFIHCGPNGKHLCLVMPIMVSDLRNFHHYNLEFVHHTKVLKEITRQVLLGLQYIHDAGFVHTGMVG